MYDYYQLVSEVRTTNSLLEENNDHLENIEGSLTTCIVLVSVVVVVKLADMCHHLMDAGFKRR